MALDYIPLTVQTNQDTLLNHKDENVTIAYSCKKEKKNKSCLEPRLALLLER